MAPKYKTTVFFNHDAGLVQLKKSSHIPLMFLQFNYFEIPLLYT